MFFKPVTMKPQPKSIPALCIILMGLLFTQRANAQCPPIKISFKDTVCWSDAHSNGIQFTAKPLSSADLWTWNFGDPNSGPLDIINYEATQTHRFTAGPGVYLVTFSEHDPNCGTLDTCFFVHIMGPEAVIDLSQITSPVAPFPLNNYYPATRMPRIVFIAVNNGTNSCGPQTVTYSTFTHNTSTAHIKYQYCNAKILNETADTLQDCYGNHKIPYVTSVTLKPTDSTVSYYIDSTELTHTWTKGSTIPSGNVYYPSAGTLTWNAMHDSNLTTCRLPNLVRFTNNSIKFRLHATIDDNTFLNVLNPAHSFQDTCKWKNYPMASDSLSYYWSFYDPGGKQCTNISNKKVVMIRNGKLWIDSTAVQVYDPTCLCTKKKYIKDTTFNWDCNYSTLAAPYHYYKGKTDLPTSGCQSVKMSVYDPVTKCKDSVQVQLKQGPPNASWDRSAYCKMTWEMQESGLAPRGYPGSGGIPLIGMMLSSQPNACAGYEYPFRIDFSQTVPICGAVNWWAVFDSANVVKYVKCPNGDSAFDFGFTGDLGPGYSPGLNGYPSGAPASFWESPPFFGRYWYNVGDTGCKTIGIVLQVGSCFDTAWYHDYICFNKLDANFNIYNVSPVRGAVKSQVLIDSSLFSSHGHVCQGNSTLSLNHITEGVRLYFFPHDTNQRNITSFYYNITREPYGDNPTYTNSGGHWYYDYAPHGTPIGFWPDSATLNPFTTINDSLKQIQNKISYIDTPHAYILVIQSGLSPKRVLYNFPFYQNEIDSLKAMGEVNISLNDERARRISARCDKSYVTIYADPGFPIAGSAQTLRLGGPGAVDSLTLPYPGFYTINAISSNLEGCHQTAQYYLVYGHYATFWADDSIICLGQPATVHWYVRYWSTNCPQPPSGFTPVGCLNGADEVPGLSNTVDFAPWDSLNPTAYRDTLTKNFAYPLRPWNQAPHPNYQPESVALNFGEPGDTLFHLGFNKYKNSPATSFPYVYKKAGAYTVTMKTVDWRGCAVYTQRRNYIKVIQVKAKFSLANKADTMLSCPPRLVEYLDSSTIAGNTYTDKVVSNGQIVDSTYTVDSIATRTWNIGFGNPIVKKGTESNFSADYLTADTFGVSLAVQSGSGCTNIQYRPHYINIENTTSPLRIKESGILSIGTTDTFTVIGGKGEFKTFTWDFGNGVIKTNVPDSIEGIKYSLADFQAAAKDSKGRALFVVRVTGTTADGCTSMDSLTIPVGNSGINNAGPGLEYLNVYPNPFNTSATVEYSLDRKTSVTLELTDITGRQIVLTTNTNQSPGKYQFDINADKYGLTPGVYILKVTLDNGFVNRHIVKF